MELEVSIQERASLLYSTDAKTGCGIITQSVLSESATKPVLQASCVRIAQYIVKRRRTLSSKNSFILSFEKPLNHVAVILTYNKRDNIANVVHTLHAKFLKSLAG